MTLVSIVTPTYDRPELLTTRAWPSVLAQTVTDWEWLVVGDGAGRETSAAMVGLDPRVRFVNLPRHDYPEDPEAFFQAKGSAPAAWGVDHARGDWVLFLGDDDALMPNALETLLGLTTEADCVYGRVEVVGHGFLGSWPPECGRMQYAMWRRALGFNVDPDSWTRNQPCDWDLWSRMLEGGVEFAFTSEVLYRYFPSTHRVPEVSAT